MICYNNFEVRTWTIQWKKEADASWRCVYRKQVKIQLRFSVKSQNRSLSESTDDTWGEHIFICVHNSCRSQIAEALGKKYLSDSFVCYSAGTETKPQINQDAVRLMKELYDIDMEETQYSKLLTDIPAPDIAISMGCNVSCPFIGRDFDENWGLEDPTDKSDEEFIKVIREIEKRVLAMKEAH